MKYGIASLWMMMFGLTCFAQQVAPNFELLGHDGKTHSLLANKGKIVVLEWYNYGCPFVRKQYDANAMQELQKKYSKKGIVWFSIVSSAAGKQGHLRAPKEASEKRIEENSGATAILLDAEGKIGKAYGAKTTPHFFIVDKSGMIAYQGAIDDAPGLGETVKVNYVAKALDQLLEQKKVEISSTTAYGCSVKY